MAGTGLGIVGKATNPRKAGQCGPPACPATTGCRTHNMNITIKDLLDAGVHFGHQARRFNPKSKKFVFANRHGISVIDLEKTYAKLEEAVAFIEQLVASGKDVLLVGTKRQAKDLVKEAAIACNMPYATSRWLGGTLTNYATVKRSIEKYKNYLRMDADGTMAKMHKKESSAIRREMTRMSRNFEGILNMGGMPGALFVVDTKTEEIAVAEAKRLGIPVVALVDTNSDPSQVRYPIPGNDDSIKAVRIIVEAVMDAIQTGLSNRRTVDPVLNRTITAPVASTLVEEQLPVSVPASVDGVEELIPEIFSTDPDEA
jgi:small subunit ribosomal protein S2